MHHMVRRSILLVVAAALAACAGAGGAGPVIEDAWLRSNPNGMGAAYLAITMPSEDRLIGAEVDPTIAARVEVHEVVDDEGRMLMREVAGGIPLPAGTRVELRPGGYHLMLLDMPEMLEVGTSVEITLRFAESPAIIVTAEVREGTDMDGMSDGTMHGG
jgi:periplasmic copper chaperone A